MGIIAFLEGILGFSSTCVAYEALTPAVVPGIAAAVGTACKTFGVKKMVADKLSASLQDKIKSGEITEEEAKAKADKYNKMIKHIPQ